MSESKSVPLWIVDAETMRVVDANPEAVELWGYPKQELIGLDALHFVPPEDAKFIHEAMAQNRWGDSGVWRCQRKDGSLFYAKLFWHQAKREGRVCNFVFAEKPGEEEIEYYKRVRYGHYEKRHIS